jgi:hypothetical protein
VIRVIATLLVAGLLLSACGTQSESAAMKVWVKQSSFHANTTTLESDVRHSATALEGPSSSVHLLHLVCDVLDFDVRAANASLPTPDAQSNTLLSHAYTDIDSGANTCFSAGTNVGLRKKAFGYLRKGLSELSEALLRVDVAAGTAKS